MKLQRTPLILLAIALLLGGFVYVYEIQGAPQREATQAKTEQLFTFKEDEVQMLSLTTPTQTFTFTKASSAQATPNSNQKDQPAQPEPAATWMMTAPEKGPASDASIAYLLNLLATGKRQQTLTAASDKQAEFGFAQPLAIADVKLSNQQNHRLILGKPNFNRSAIYAQVDPPANPTSELSVVLVSNDFENAVTRPLSEWQSKKASANKKAQNQEAQDKQPEASQKAGE